jgi:hypothetical protein
MGLVRALAWAKSRALYLDTNTSQVQSGNGRGRVGQKIAAKLAGAGRGSPTVSATA